jgi:hypothetical protein
MTFESNRKQARYMVRIFNWTVLTNGSGYKEYKVTGQRAKLEEPKLKFRVHHMDLTSDDSERIKLDPKHVPNPVVGEQRSSEFHLPLGLRVVYGSCEVSCLSVNGMLFLAFKGFSRTKDSSSFSLIGKSIQSILNIYPQLMPPYGGVIQSKL